MTAVAMIGVEGGGSHTHAVVADEAGAVRGAAGTDDPANWEDVGIGAASAALRACVREALDRAGVRPEAIAAATFGLAGIDFPIDAQRLSGIPESMGLTAPSSIVNDSFVALRAGTDASYGLVIVAGTGSVVAGRNPDGHTFRTLGLGPTFGDSGSASEVSEAAITAMADAYLGRGPETLLAGLLCERAGVGSVVEFLEAAARGRLDGSTFAPQVVEAAAAGDGCARTILGTAGRALGANAIHVARMLGMEHAPFELVLAGGMLRSGSPFLLEALEEEIRPVLSAARTVPLNAPPVVGSVLLAAEAAGLAPGGETRSRLAAATIAALHLDARSDLLS